MKRFRKPNCVSWAKGSNLCQVRIFEREDCPSKVGNGGQASLKIKPANLQHSKNQFNELPVVFERPDSTSIVRVPWNCPPKIVLNCDWNVVAGEESQEVKVQELRESRVLEALYPSPKHISANSYVSIDVEREFYDDTLTPSIPVIPIEEEEETKSLPPSLPESVPNSFNSQPSSLKHALLPSSNPNSEQCNAPVQQSDPASGMLLDQDTPLVATDAFAVRNSKEQGSLFDTDLLIKILSDPKMVSKLAKELETPTISSGEQVVVSKPVTQVPPPSFPSSAPVSSPFPSSAPVSAPLPPVRSSSNLPRCSQPSSTAPSRPKPAIAAEREAARVSAPIPTVSNLTSMAKQVQTNLNTASLESTVAKYIGTNPSLESTVAKYIGTNPSLESTVAKYAGITSPSPFLGPPLMPNRPKTMAQTKDITYMKNLIREHGTDKTQHTTFAQNVRNLNNMRPREERQNFHKVCSYFNTPMGCRNGSNCPYQHDFSHQFQTGATFESPQFKRVRFCREIFW